MWSGHRSTRSYVPGVVLMVAVSAQYPVPVARGQCDPDNVFKVFASDGVRVDQFGSAVGISGDLAVVGAFGADPFGESSGEAYIFQWNGNQWNEVDQLFQPDGDVLHLFGWDVAIDGDRALVSAPGEDDEGAVYVFERDGVVWNMTAELRGSDTQPGNSFGHAVALEGTRAIISDVSDDEVAAEAGAAYIFDFDGASWAQTAKLTADDAAALDSFGYRVDLSGDRVVVSAAGDDDLGGQSGSAYIFEFDGASWTQTAKLLADDGGVDDQFGSSVAISRDRAIVGATLWDSPQFDNVGAAYVYELDGTEWGQSDQITADNGRAGDSFGYAAALEDGIALITSPLANTPGTDSGAIYFFQYDGADWIQALLIVAGDTAPGDHFGWAVDLWETRSIVGSPGDTPATFPVGATGFFDLECTSHLPFDSDGDTDVDLVDHAAMTDCLSGPGTAPPGGCDFADGDADDDVDLDDVAGMQLAYTDS